MERNVEQDVASRMPGTDVEAELLPDSTQGLAHYISSLGVEGRKLPLALADDLDVLRAEATGPLGETFALMAAALRTIPQGPVAPETKEKIYIHDESPFWTLSYNPQRLHAEVHYKPALQKFNGFTAPDRRITLSKKEGEFLEALLENPADIVPNQTLITKVWKLDPVANPVTHYVRLYKQYLEKKLGYPLTIFNVFGEGYSLTPQFPEDPNSWLPRNGHPQSISTGDLTDAGAIDIIEPPYIDETPEPISYTVLSGQTRISLYPRGRKMYSSRTGEEKRLGSTEFLLLRCFMRNPGIVSFEQIHKNVWPDEPDLSKTQVRLRTAKLVERVKNKLGGDQQTPIINNAWGQGYNIAPAANPSNLQY